MDSIDLVRLERRARQRYEWSRLARAVLGVLPLLALVGLAGLLSQRLDSTAVFGGFACAAALLMLWYGREPQRAVWPGAVAGLFPLGLSLAANALHGCAMHGCSSFCIPACAAGGVAAALWVSAAGLRRQAGRSFWIAASALALATGAMGCACAGYLGVAGLFGGYLVILWLRTR